MKFFLLFFFFVAAVNAGGVPVKKPTYIKPSPTTCKTTTTTCAPETTTPEPTTPVPTTPVPTTPQPSCENPNEEYKEAHPICKATCAKRNPLCATQVTEFGCYCKDGFVLNKAGGTCIDVADCPSCKDANEEYSEDSVVVSYCDSNDEKVSGCVPKSGYVYKSKNNKVTCKKERCSDGCGQNEEHSRNCRCEGTCSKRSPTSCAKNRVGFVCKVGFVRDNGKCINPKTCKCGESQAWAKTCDDCEETCGNRKPARKCASKMGCVCAPGLIRDCKGGKCIDPKKCPKA